MKLIDITKEEELQKVIEKNKIKVITSTEEIVNLFDFKLMDIGKKDLPIFKGKGKAIFIFDNEKFNETYLIDVVLQMFEFFEKPIDLQIYYCTDYNIRKFLFAPDLKEDSEEMKWFINDHEKFEKNVIIPSIVMTKDFLEMMYLIRENKISPISVFETLNLYNFVFEEKHQVPKEFIDEITKDTEKIEAKINEEIK